MASGLKLVRKELGPDALILSTRTVRNGKLGLLGKPTVEITAAIDNNWPKEEPAPTPEVPTFKTERPAARRLGHPFKKKRIDTTVGTDDIAIDYGAPLEQDHISEDHLARAALLSGSPAPPVTSDDGLRSEVDQLKGLVEQLAAQLAATGSSPAASAPEPSSSINRDRLPAAVLPLFKLLEQQGIEGIPAATIAASAAAQLTSEELARPSAVRRFALKGIEGLLRVSPPSFHPGGKQKRIALIGPTGVGKTTTLAKLAAHYLTNHSNDTYRIAAIEQLKVYGEIMHLPVDVVISPAQLTEALNRHADKSLILIDTAGRSPRDSLCIEELTGFLPARLGIEKHLVLSAATRENELSETIRHFSKVGVDKMIFTKIDECLKTGVILNIQQQHQSPLSYITNGQRVPEDLLQITRRSVAELIMSHHEGNTHD